MMLKSSCAYCGFTTLDVLLNEHLLECKERKKYWEEVAADKEKNKLTPQMLDKQEDTLPPAESGLEHNPTIPKFR